MTNYSLENLLKDETLCDSVQHSPKGSPPALLSVYFLKFLLNPDLASSLNSSSEDPGSRSTG